MNSETDPQIHVNLNVEQKRNVFIQCLLDCNIETAKEDQFLRFRLLDEECESIAPVLPNNYNSQKFSNYSQNG